jgi:hypothetical protein
MKSNAQPSIYFSPHVPKGPNQEPSAKTSYQSPYLNGKTRVADNQRASLMADSSLAAALRYIAHSK